MIASLSASSNSSVAIAMAPTLLRHPNRLAFFGVLCPLDVPSDRPPSGARGHKVILTRQAAELALDTLPGMAIDCTPHWDGHDSLRKFGIITMARVKSNKLQVGGYIFAKDFPQAEHVIRGKDMGMSYECDGANVEDMNAETWVITKVAAFTGAAVLDRNKAAYRSTRFELA